MINEIDNMEIVYGIQRVCYLYLIIRNNFGYFCRYDNKNLCMVDDEKLNINRKEIIKENFFNLYFF